MEKDQEDLVLLHFNDAYHIEENKKGELGFKNFYDCVQRARQKYKNSLLIFSGDCFSPSRLSKLFKGWHMAKCIKLLNIDIACYGNHDFDFPHDHSIELAKYCGFPWLMGNIKFRETKENIGKGLSYYIMERSGIKIGFMGLAGPDFPGRLISQYKQKLLYIKIDVHAKKICQILKEKGCQLIIALTHARYPIDQELAKKVPQIDLILGGHDHHPKKAMINEIPIIKSGSDFEFLSIIKVQSLEAEMTRPTMRGRRWMFDHNMGKVVKAKNSYPQLDALIKELTTEVDDHNKRKSLANNKPRVQVTPKPQDE